MQSMRERIHLKNSKCQGKRFCLTLSFHINSSQHGTIFVPWPPPRGHLTMPGDSSGCHNWEERVLLGNQECKLLTSYNSQNSPYHKTYLVPHVSIITVKKTVLWNLHYIKAMNSFFHNKFMICLQMLMTCDFSLDFYFVNTSEQSIYDGSG